VRERVVETEAPQAVRDEVDAIAREIVRLDREVWAERLHGPRGQERTVVHGHGFRLRELAAAATRVRGLGGHVNYTEVIIGGERRLSDEQHLVWDPIATPLGLSPYTCKALYVCGLIRQRLEAAGLSLGNLFLLDAQSSASGQPSCLVSVSVESSRSVV
jgi:hypothetical protein